MGFKIPDRIRRLPRQFFVELVAGAEARMAAGHDVINLGRGGPDLPTPPHIVDRLCHAARDPRTHGYSPFSGLRSLREALARWYEYKFGVHLDPDREVAILFGSKTGLVEISLCVLEAGDTCLMPDPGYPDYWSGVALAGARTLSMPLVASNHFLPDYDSLSAADLRSARLMFLNYPCNPTATVAPLEFFRETVAFAARHGIIVAHDLAYGDLVFDGRRPVSFLQAEGAKEVGVEFYTLSKSYNMAGWRVGFAAGNARVIEAITTLQDHLFVSLFPAVQTAAIEALLGEQGCVADLVRTYQERRDTLIDGLLATGWEVPRPEGTFYAWLPVPRGFTSREFTGYLLEKADIVVAPGTGFGPVGEGYVRASLTAPRERIAEAVQRIRSLPLFA